MPLHQTMPAARLRALLLAMTSGCLLVASSAGARAENDGLDFLRQIFSGPAAAPAPVAQPYAVQPYAAQPYDAPIRQLLDAILQTVGWERVLGGSWEEVRGALDRVDLVVLDHRLPGASGIEVVEEVRARRPDLPTVMLTGDSTVQDRAEHLGVAGFLRKPFDVADLLAILARVEPSVDLREPADDDVEPTTAEDLERSED